MHQEDCGIIIEINLMIMLMKIMIIVCRINNEKTITSESFEYKAKLNGSTKNDNNTLNAEVFVPLK